MSFCLASSALILAASLAGQPPSGRSERPLSQEQVAELEAKHLQNIRQVTYGFFRAGEGYFRPDGKGIIFQAVPNLPASIFLEAKPNQYEYQIFTADLSPDARPVMVSTGLGACTCSFYHPDGKSIIFGSTHLSPSHAPPRSAYSRSGSRYRWSFPEGMDIFKADPDGKNLVRLTQADGYDAEGILLPRRQADRLHLVPGWRRRHLHHGRRRQERRGGSSPPRDMTAAPSSRPTASGSSTGATARATTCSRSTSTTPKGLPSGR